MRFLSWRSLGHIYAAKGCASSIGYTLTDRATWATLRNRQILTVLAAGDPALFNPYGSILVNPAKGAHIKAADAKVWHEWLTSEEGRRAITSFRIGGEQLFYPTGTTPRS